LPASFPATSGAEVREGRRLIQRRLAVLNKTFALVMAVGIVCASVTIAQARNL
jgi:hypothetical protein